MINASTLLLEDQEMPTATVEIRIMGEEAEAFAKMLRETGDISQYREIVHRDGRNGKAFVLLLTVGLVADTITISQGLANLKKTYDDSHKQGKVEAITVKPDQRTCDFSEFLSLSHVNPVDNLSQNLPKISLPSLEEIAKLPIAERHKLLSPFMDDMAEVFNNDPELMLWSVLEGEGIK